MTDTAPLHAATDRCDHQFCPVCIARVKAEDAAAVARYAPDALCALADEGDFGSLDMQRTDSDGSCQCESCNQPLNIAYRIAAERCPPRMAGKEPHPHVIAT